MTNNITISKASLTAGAFLKVSYEEHFAGNSSRKHPGMTCTDPVHEDLVKLFALLPPHMALICEEITNEEFIISLPEDDDTRKDFIIEMGETVPTIAAKKLRGKKQTALPYANTKEAVPELPADKFSCDSITIKGYGGTVEAVTILGSKRLSNFRYIPIGTYEIKLTPEDYKYADDLALIFEAIKFEVHEFLFNGKKAPETIQPELFGDGVGLEPRTNAYKDPTEAISDKEDEEFIENLPDGF